MSMTPSREAAQAKLEDVVRLLERHRVLETLAARQQTDKRDLLEQIQRRENLAELKRHVRGIHPADLAVILASLSTTDRVLVFRQLEPRDAGLTLVELDPEVRATIVDVLDERELAVTLATLDADDLAYLSPSLPDDVVRTVSQMLGARDRSWILDTSRYPEETVGRLMSPDVVAVRLEQTVGETIDALRQGTELPAQTDRLFAVDARNLLRGSVPLQDLVRASPAAPLASVLLTDVAAFEPGDHAERAAKAFERYDLISAPVVDELGKLIGRITIDAVVDYLRAESDQDALTRAGLRGAEDLFAPAVESVRNRWPWLAFNLLTAFTASRVIGMFEDTITQLVALAALMPIVASIGGNTGNQTVALVIRALALDQLGDTQGRLARKELTVAMINGVTWGLVVALLAFWLYRSVALSAVMMAAVFLNLIVAALVGVAVPLGLRWAGRDPAHGASVLLTFVTDGMGFFLFLGLARLLLV
jgi:magnesium transporter